MIRLINIKYNSTVKKIVLFCYLLVTLSFVFHYHHINLSDQLSIFSGNTSQQNSSTSGINHGVFVCIVHSNFQSLHNGFLLQIFFDNSNAELPFLNYVEEYNFRFEKQKQAEANPLRAPPCLPEII